MIESTDVKNLKVPAELQEFIGDYHKALIKRADMDLLGDSEFKCFKRFLDMYASGKYRFAVKGMRRMFSFLNLLVYIDEDGKPRNLELYPVQRFILCGIFGLRHPDGNYVVNTANIYLARRNGKSFLLSSVALALMCMSRFRNELMILASCKGQNATICLNEILKFIDTTPSLQEVFSSVNRTIGSIKAKLTGNRIEMFRTGNSAKKSLDGFTNRVAIVDEEMLCDEIITKTIQDGQAHFKSSLLVTMSTAQFEVGSDNHKKWMQLRKQLYAEDLPENRFLFLADPNDEDISAKDWANIKTWGKANPVLLFQKDGHTIKEHIRKKYMQTAKEAVAAKSFALQNFATKQANIWYSSQDRSLCSFEQLMACRGDYSFEDVIKLGYTSWYLGVDLSQSVDMTACTWCCMVGVSEEGKVLPADEVATKHKLFVHVISWLPKAKLVQHIDTDKFCYYDYVDKELLLCDTASGENIDINQVYEYIEDIKNTYDLEYVTITADPYNVAGIQDKLDSLANNGLILQNQSPKSLSAYIESLSGYFKDNLVLYKSGGEDLLEKAITSSVMVRNTSGYYSVEKITLRADSSVRIDQLDSLIDAWIACYIDFNNGIANGDELVDEWSAMFK